METVQEREERTLEFWEKNNIFKKSVESRPQSKQFVFYDGPPFATGLPHYGHILGLTAKDLFPRFWTMKGYRVERRWGWDCHGLPIENVAEKELGIKEKKEIERMGVAKFNEFCRSKVLWFASEWKKTVRRMGNWIEFDNSYKTMDNSYMESVWYNFKKLYEDGYLYEGKKVLLYCPRCETPLSNAEISMDNSYRDITEKTATVKFPVKNEKETFFLAWTTTPWTLIGNVALAINPQLTYATIKIGNEKFILAKNRLSDIKEKYIILEEFKGDKLLQKEYEPLYHIPSDKKGHYVINGGNEVSAEEGTGIVHMALYGEFDYQMVKKYNLPVIQHIGKEGKVTLGPERFKGLWFKQADKNVLEDLTERNLLYKAENHTHSYPFCYRCETPLFYNAVDSWFVDIQKIKSKLIQRNKEINWHPSHIQDGRFKYILETAPDWSLTRNRFWATAIPVWKCTSCSSIEVIGNIEELRSKSKEKIPRDLDLHKHIVDNIHLVCNKCGKIMNRVPEVIDCWFESGSMPYAAKHYPFENKEWFKDNFPADFVSEYVGQVRAWFYYMHVLGVLMFDKAPFENVVVSGNVLAADGSKMSKSRKNYPDPHIIFEKYGADALKFYLMSSPLMRAEDLNFKEEGVTEVYRRVITLLSNVLRFYTLCKIKTRDMPQPHTVNVLDKWITSKLNLLINEVTIALDGYDTITACSMFSAFIEDLSTWYVRRSRDRCNSDNNKEKQEAVETIAYVLLTLSKISAPLLPFLSEEIYQEFRKEHKQLPESVHLEIWPTSEKSKIQLKLHEEMQSVRAVVSKALEEREKTKIAVKQPLNKAVICGVELKQEYTNLIAEEINVKEIVLKPGKELKIELDTKITEDLLQEGYAREVIRRVQEMRKQAGLQQGKEINLYISSQYDLSRLKKEISRKVNASTILFKQPSEKLKWHTIAKIKDYEFTLAFSL